MSDYHNTRAKDILETIKYATIATASKDGEPWNSPVYFGFDELLNLYWTSDKASRHSQNIRENGAVFFVIYNSLALEGKFVGQGLYIKAEAVELDNPAEVQMARKITQAPKGGAADDEYQRFTGDAMRRAYRAVPTRMWVNDIAVDSQGNYLKDSRVEVLLEAVRTLRKEHA